MDETSTAMTPAVQLARVRTLNEQYLCLGFIDAAMRNKREWIAVVMAWFDTDAIDEPFYKSVVDGMLALTAASVPVSDATFLWEIMRQRKAHKIDLDTVAELITQSVSQGGHLVFYARRVWESYRARMASDELTDSSASLQAGRKVAEVFDEITGVMGKYQPAPTIDASSNKEVFQQMVDELDGKRERTVLKTGIEAFDGPIGGVNDHSMVVIAADTGEGKSVFLGQVALNCAKRYGKQVMVFSLEMSTEEMYDRWAANLGRANKRENRKKYLEGLAQLRLLTQDNDDRLLHVAVGAFTVSQIRNAVIARNALVPVSLVVVDYLQLVDPGKQVSSRREEEMASISRGLKRLAMETHIPVFAASQVNDDGKLRESRAIGHNANVIVKLAPNEQHSNQTRMTVTIVKSRNSEKAQKVAWWDKPTFTIRNMEPEDGDF